MKPVIGITSFNENKSDREYASIGCSYVNSIAAAGGIPIIIPVLSGDNIAAQYIKMIDGLLFTGGGDILPSFYGEKTIKEVNSISIERDACEKELFTCAFKIDMPILGICRGIQVINAFSGGTLYQNISSQKDGAMNHNNSGMPRDDIHHSVSIEKGSMLYSIFKSESIDVNSFHHQAVREAAANFKITALSPDGIIEGIECTDRTFIMGVQWHPEELWIKYPEFLGIFKALINQSEIYNKIRKG